MRILFILQYLFLPIYKCTKEFLSEYLNLWLPMHIKVINKTIYKNCSAYYKYSSDFLNTLPNRFEKKRNYNYCSKVLPK